MLLPKLSYEVVDTQCEMLNRRMRDAGRAKIIIAEEQCIRKSQPHFMRHLEELVSECIRADGQGKLAEYEDALKYLCILIVNLYHRSMNAQIEVNELE